MSEPFATPIGSVSWQRARAALWLSRMGKVLYAAGAFASLVPVGQPFWIGLSVLSFIAWILFLTSFVFGFLQTNLAASLSVADSALHVRSARGGEDIIPLSRITGALIVERPLGQGTMPTVEIELDVGDRLTVRFAEPATAPSLVEALGFGPRGKRARVRLATPARRLLHPIIALVAWCVAMGTSVGVVAATDVDGTEFAVWWMVGSLLALGLYSVAKSAMAAPEITVGDDGVRVERGVRRSSRGLREILPARHMWIDRERLRAVEALVAQRAAAPRPVRIEAFARQQGSLAEWRARLSDALGGGSYRGAAATVDDARAVLRSPDARPDERVGAALALRVSGEPPEHIRVAAHAIVDDRTRSALEAVADGDDARAETALRTLALRR